MISKPASLPDSEEGKQQNQHTLRLVDDQHTLMLVDDNKYSAQTSHTVMKRSFFGDISKTVIKAFNSVGIFSSETEKSIYSAQSDEKISAKFFLGIQFKQPQMHIYLEEGIIFFPARFHCPEHDTIFVVAGILVETNRISSLYPVMVDMKNLSHVTTRKHKEVFLSWLKIIDAKYITHDFEPEELNAIEDALSTSVSWLQKNSTAIKKEEEASTSELSGLLVCFLHCLLHSRFVFLVSISRVEQLQINKLSEENKKMEDK
ncbi:MAG: hypothetical protein WCG10_07930, partial [Chlamydiota bacterium]